jgi:hypothetical protein
MLLANVQEVTLRKLLAVGSHGASAAEMDGHVNCLSILDLRRVHVRM